VTTRSQALARLRDPDPSELGQDPEAFLRRLAGPTWIELSGECDGPTRVVTTLVHGNEPSGCIAVHRFLRQGVRPRVTLALAVLSVEAALSEPAFSHRARIGGADLNRSFQDPWSSVEGQLARAVVERVRASSPACVVDLHNTSGRGPAYAVCTEVDARHHALTAPFARRIVHTDLRLGTLAEACSPLAPTVTIECGGAREASSHERAYAGLCAYARAEDPLARPGGAAPLPVVRHPLRVELRPGARVAFADGMVADADLTLAPDVDTHNFGFFERDQALGWLGARGLSSLRVVGAQGELPIEAFFRADGPRLCVARRLEPLMVTTDPGIASSDCLFYLVPDPHAG